MGKFLQWPQLNGRVYAHRPPLPFCLCHTPRATASPGLQAFLSIAPSPPPRPLWLLVLSESGLCRAIGASAGGLRGPVPKTCVVPRAYRNGGCRPCSRFCCSLKGRGASPGKFSVLTGLLISEKVFHVQGVAYGTAPHAGFLSVADSIGTRSIHAARVGVFPLKGCGTGSSNGRSRFAPASPAGAPSGLSCC